MTTSYVDNTLRLIVATIFADKRVYASEVETFLKSCLKLNFLQQLNPKMSEAKLLNWYEMNKDNVCEKLASPYFKDWFYDILDQIADVPEKQAILNVMYSISEADGEVHVSERALMVLAKRHWQMG